MSQDIRNRNKLNRITEVSEFTSLGKSTIWLWVSQGKFPKPITLSPTVKVWRSSDLDAWIEGRASGGDHDAT